jgi:hypothetical protein
VADAVRAVVAARPLVALDIAATWQPEETSRNETGAVLSALLSSTPSASITGIAGITPPGRS